MPWKLKNYVDQSGQNVVARWFDDLPVRSRAKINVRLRHAMRLTDLKMPLFRWFSGRWNGICEIRLKVDNVFYRLLGCRGPGEDEITLLYPTSKKSSDVSDGEKQSAVDRRLELLKNRERTVDHDFEE